MRTVIAACLSGLALCGIAWAQPADGSVDRPDVRLHFRSVGQGAPLVILAGGPGQDVKQLSPIVDRISAIRRCVLFEQRGTGRSTLKKIDRDTIRLELYLADLESLRKHLGLKRISLLGHSWGAMYAMAYAAAYPEKVESLVLISSGPAAVQYFGPAGDNLAQRRGMLHVRGALAETQELTELRPFFYDQRKAEEYAARPKVGEVASSVSGPLIQDLFTRKFDVRPGLKKVKCPTLLVQGRQDAMPEQFVLEVRDCMRGARLAFIERAGHFPWVEQPTAFFEALLPFLRARR